MSLLGRGERGNHENHRPGETIQVGRRYPLTKGKGVMIEEQQGVLGYEMLSDLLSRKGGAQVKGLLISRQHPSLLRARFALEGSSMIWLATQPGESTADPTSLGMLVRAVTEFLTKNSNAVVLLDGLEYLATNNDFKKVARTVEQINDSVMSYHGYLLITLDPRTFDPKELAILEKNFEIIRPGGSTNGSG